MSEFADFYRAMRKATPGSRENFSGYGDGWKDFEKRLCKEPRHIESDLVDEITATLNAPSISKNLLERSLMMSRMVAGVARKKVTKALTQSIARQAFESDIPEVRGKGYQALQEIDNNCANQIDRPIFEKTLAKVMAKKDLRDSMPALTVFVKNHKEFLVFLQAAELVDFIRSEDGSIMRGRALNDAICEVYPELDVERPRGRFAEIADRIRIHL